LRSNPDGIENQVWKDSWDSYFHADGTIANHQFGVASVEVQRVAYDALLDAADIYEKSNNQEEVSDLRSRAEKLKKAIFEHFWTEDKGGFFVLGTERAADGSLRQLKVRSSNMGHLLNSRLLDGDDPDIVRYREAIISHLFSKEMLSPNGIRTIASDEVRYRPGAYHNGSVWPWDNYLIAQGLRRHGYHLLADKLSAMILNIVNETKKFPEYVRGDNTQPTLNAQTVDVWDEINERHSRVEQPPQYVQAWSVAAALAIKYRNKLSREAGEEKPRDKFEASLINSLPTSYSREPLKCA
jgi:glycogen debranching enzyme